MKGKYYQALFLVGVLPVLGLTGLFFWAILNQAPQPSPKASMVNSPALSTTVDSLRSEVQTIASSLITAIKKTHEDFPSLTAHNGDADLENFKSTHSGVSGMVVISLDGKAVKTLPPTPALVEPAYGSSEEFKNIVNHLKEKPGQTYQFYTQRLGYPAFIFAIDLPNKTIVEAAFNLGQFFRPPDPKNGEIFLLDAGSGHYFYHSIPAKMSETFNPNQEPWLTKVQTDLTSQQSGSSLSSQFSGGLRAAGLGFLRSGPCRSFRVAPTSLAGRDTHTQTVARQSTGIHPDTNGHGSFHRSHRDVGLGLHSWGGLLRPHLEAPTVG